MAYYRDIREYLAALEENGRLRRVRRAISKDTELYPLVRLQYRGLPPEQRQAFLFENVVGAAGRRWDVPVAIGILATSPQIFALGLKCRVEDIAGTLARAEANPIPPVTVGQGPVQEEVHTGAGLLEHGGLAEFPVPIATPGLDAAPYITAPCWVTKDPDSGIPNVGMYRAMLKSPVRTGLNFASRAKGGFVHMQKCRQRGIPLQAAIVIGGPPSLNYAAMTPLAADVSELDVAGAIAGEPLPLVRCRTVDLEVPANAEIVIEGEVPTDDLEREAPFGESQGFVSPQELNPYFKVTCITHRRSPIWLAAVTQYPPSEETLARSLSGRAALCRHLTRDLQLNGVLDVCFFEEVIGVRMVAIKMDSVEPGYAWRVLEAAGKRLPFAKIIVAVDKDVNIQDLGSVFLAVCTRTLPHRDYRIETMPATLVTDYSLGPLGKEPFHKFDKLDSRAAGDRPEASRLYIDATVKWPLPPLSLPGAEFMGRALRIWQEEGLPQLSLREPWSSVNLGFWSEENERHARAAVSGDYYRAGEDYGSSA